MSALVMIYTGRARDNRYSLMLMYCNLVESVADVDDKLWRCCLGNVLLYQTPTVIQTHTTTAPSCSNLYLNIELNIASSYFKVLDYTGFLTK